jgi:hypothetical protein
MPTASGAARGQSAPGQDVTGGQGPDIAPDAAPVAAHPASATASASAAPAPVVLRAPCIACRPVPDGSILPETARRREGG